MDLLFHSYLHAFLAFARDEGPPFWKSSASKNFPPIISSSWSLRLNPGEWRCSASTSLIGFHPGDGNTHHQGRFKAIEPVLPEEDHACESLDVVLHSGKAMGDLARDLRRVGASDPVAYRHAPVRYAPSASPMWPRQHPFRGKPSRPGRSYVHRNGAPRKSTGSTASTTFKFWFM